MVAKYSIVTCDRFGANEKEHPDAKITTPIRDEINGGGGLTFTIPITDPYYPDAFTPWAREVQVWRDGATAPYYWGPVTTLEEKNRSTVEVQVGSLMEHFDGLHFGKAERTNQLGNGGFDNSALSIAPWTAVGVTANVVDQWGTKPGQNRQLNLYQGGDGLDTFVTQTVQVPGGVYWTLSADFHIRMDAQWVGPAYENRGLYVECLATDNTTVEDVQTFVIDDNTRRGVFQRASVGIHTPPGPPRFLRVRLYATRCTNPTPVAPRPPGGIIWDNVKLTAMESTSFVMQDLGSICNAIVAHAQDPAFGKVNLNITGGSPSTGVFVDRVYQHAEHENIGSALRQLAEEGLCDVGFELLSATQRLFRCYAPQKGTFKPDVVLTLHAEGGLAAVPVVRRDGTKTVTSVIAAAEGQSGPERDEAAAIDTSELGGIVREQIIESAEFHDRLINVAQEYLRTRKRVVQVPEVIAHPEVIGKLNLGDSFGLDIPAPGAIDANYRVVARELDTNTDLLRLELNLA